MGKNGTEATPCVLGDYVLTPTTQGRVNGLVLPNNPAIKILAVTLEK